MTYEQIVEDAKNAIASRGVTVVLDGDGPRIISENELCELVSTYVGDDEAIELERSLIVADLAGV